MNHDQILISSVLVATVGLFLWGKWRHDVVALTALLACVFLGLLSPELAFTGFGHPAVITVACVLVLSYGLQITGAVDAMMEKVLPSSNSPTFMLIVLTSFGATLSAFMNNVGAMALLMPVAIQIANKLELPPGKILMPLAFGTILGGMTTMVGTPPNLIVSAFRADIAGESFAMFDYTPVGLSVAIIGILFVSFIGWRLVPSRKRSGANSFDTGTYLTEVRVTEGSKSIGKTLRQVDQDLDETDGQIVGLVRNEFRVSAPSPYRVLKVGDILVIEVEPESLSSVLSTIDVKLVADVPNNKTADEEQSADIETNLFKDALLENELVDKEISKNDSDSDAIVLQELVAVPRSGLIGTTAKELQIRARFGINLLAISRQGNRSVKRLRSTNFAAGDVLLMQGTAEAIAGFATALGCMPLAKREIRIPNPKKAILAFVIMAIAVTGAATGWVPAAISFAAGMLAFMALSIVPPRDVYESIDWPVIVLLGALIPVATVTATTGTADVLAKALLDNVAQGHPIVALTLILVVTMTLSDFMNNAATAAVMCPIAVSVAVQLGVSPDSFLMAVAIGASCAFLTPIGHQCNTLILGPGGFGFGDYWRMGLPLEILVIVISIPMLLIVWPL